MIENAFRLGLMVQDTNSDRIADAVCGHVIVPSSPGAAENTAAANLAARLGFETSALTLPIVLSSGSSSVTVASCPQSAATLWIGRESLPATSTHVDPLLSELQVGEGGVFVTEGGLLFAGGDPAGLLAAANDYSAHAPYQWSVSADRLQSISTIVNVRLREQKLPGTVALIGITYQSGQPGIHRAILQVSGTTDRAAIRAALMPPEGESPLHSLFVRELQLRFSKPLLSPSR
jgi:hypothetical protein